MPDGQVLEFTRVTKRFNDVTAVSDFSARVEPGVVTAFLGPNGAGKTTTLRILLGQVRATSGTATIGGVAYPELRHPLRTIGSVLEETMYRPRRSASRQLTIAAKANGIPLSRVDEVLSLVGLEHESEGRIGSFSLGMRQRLSVAHALLGDPGALVFDEPANGLDPEGIRWMRLLMRRLADEGRTVLVSSHVLSEIEQVADNVLVLSKGQLVLSSGIEKLADPTAGSVVVDAADRAALTSALSAAGFEVEVLRSGLTVRGGNAGTVGAIAASAGIALSTLVQRGPTLEDVFIELVRGGKLEPRAVAAASQLAIAEESVIVAESAAPDAAASAPASDAPDVPLAAVPAFGASAAVDGDGVDPVTASIADDAVDADDAVTEVETETETETTGAATPSDTSDRDAADAAADDAADAADAAADVEHAAAELGYAADASDANDAEDAADIVSEAADDHVEQPREDDTLGEVAPEDARPSFDEILFGTAPASTSDADAESDGSSAEAGDDDTAPHTDEHSGVEFFTELDASGETGETASEAEDDAEGDVAAEAAEEDDPRSAAVSSMLAAAARAYYEDEPKDYPLGDGDGDSAGAEAESTDAADHPESDHDAHWSVASTGVIDQVPLSDDTSSEDSDGDQHHEHQDENLDGEHQEHQGEHHEGEGEHHEHHDGEHHQS